jgi:hypothetical protein
MGRDIIARAPPGARKREVKNRKRRVRRTLKALLNIKKDYTLKGQTFI